MAQYRALVGAGLQMTVQGDQQVDDKPAEQQGVRRGEPQDQYGERGAYDGYAQGGRQEPVDHRDLFREHLRGNFRIRRRKLDA